MSGGRLLVVSWEMPPLSGPRAVQVTRTLVELARRGWRSRVVCFGPRSARYQQDDPVPVEELSGGAVVRERVPSPEEWFAVRALWRLCPPLKRLPDEKRVWVGRAAAAARRLIAREPADLLVSFAQPWSDHLVGLRLHRETGLPWVAHFSDPWVDSPYERGPAWQQRVRARLEREVLEAATRVVFVNQHLAGRAMARYPASWRARAHVVPQGFVPAASPAGPASAPPRGGPLRLAYTGRFYHGVRTPEPLLGALAELDRTRPLTGRLLVTFVGADMDRYARRARALGLDGIVRFTGRLAPPDARREAAAAHVLLVIDAPSDGPSLFLPSKLVDYLPLRRPILGITPAVGPSAELIGALGYPAADPRDAPGIVRALTLLLDAHAAGTLGPSPQHDAVARAYDIRETTAAFERVLLDAWRGAP